MKKSGIKQIVLSLFTLTLMGSSFSVLGQYYYFDSGTTSYPYQQGCPEELNVKVTTHTGSASAGLLRLLFDPARFSYATSLTATVLQNTLFHANTSTFLDWTNSSLFPSRVDTGTTTILQLDRNNGSGYFIGTGIYGTILFNPRYAPTTYTGSFSIIYNGDTIRTTLSNNGINIIVPSEQAPYLTGIYEIIQEPCLPDTTNPSISVSVPSIVPPPTTKKSYISGISLSLADNGGVGGSNVPFVWTGGGIRTGNPGGVITNQYGIDLSTFTFTISGNATSRTFLGTQFSTGNVSASLFAGPSGKTWQFLDKNYNVNIASGELFDYGIEKTITITASVRDRRNHTGTFVESFNAPVRPWAYGTFSPSNGTQFVNTNAPVLLGIQDDRAGVDSGTIIVTLSGINGTSYGPYVFTGDALNLSAVVGSANYPDYTIAISGHIAFPSSGTIRVSIDAYDRAGNIDDIDDYSFSTRPSCAQLGCCNQISLQTGTNLPILYDPSTIYISGGYNATFSTGIGDGTGYINCNLPVAGVSIYNGKGTSSGSAVFVSFFDGNELIFSGASNIRAVLDGNTVYLSTVFVPPPLTPPSGPGGGPGLKYDNCLLPGSSLPGANEDGIDSSESYYDQTCEEAPHAAASLCPIEDASYDIYSEEVIDAFQEAYGLGVTNKCPIEEARLKEPLLRKELVKMLVFFSVKILGIMPDTNKTGCDQYADMQKASDEMKFYTKIGCQLEVIGMQPDGITPMKNFYPDQTVTRAQFGTTLSRLIFGRRFNGEKPYWYSRHLDVLKEFGIVKLIKPDLKETRGFVLIIFKRVRESGLVEQFRLSAAAKNGAIALR